MEITHINLTDLKPCPLNVRRHGDTSGADLMPSIRRKGVQQPLLVRPNCEGFEVVAGQRRFNACTALAKEGEPITALPCIIIDGDDDAAVIEASLIENIERLPMDEIDQYEAFAKLMAQDRTVADIAAAFGVSERLVQQRLAIANLYPPILTAYRQHAIKAGDIRLLTMATKRQQKAWWKLFKDETQWQPSGHQLKQWLFGGAVIPTANALFDLADYTGGITTNLFGEDSYFADIDQFWRLQSKAMAELRERYQSEGWSEVVICEIGVTWYGWEYAETAKEDGGRVYLTCSRDGEVTCHEGYLTTAEARRRQADEDGDAAAAKPQRSELTKPLQNYLTLHRHNAVRTELLKRPDIALRLAVAHMMAGSSLWQIKAEPQRAATSAIGESIAASPTQETFRAASQEIRDLLGLSEDQGIVEQGWRGHSLSDIFERLLALDDAQVGKVMAYAMAESLAAAEPIVDLLGTVLAVNMHDHWQPEETFFELLRDKSALNAMVAELAGGKCRRSPPHRYHQGAKRDIEGLPQWSAPAANG
jgi:ParB family chromosome partitioning protein